MRLTVENIEDLDSKTYKRLYRLNNSNKYERWWAMRPTLVALKNDNPRYWRTMYGKYRTNIDAEGYVILLKNDKGTIVSWSLLCNNKSGRGWEVMVFTSKKYRKRGYGTVVLHKAFEYAKEKFNECVTYYPHDCNSIAFFSSSISSSNFNGIAGSYEPYE